MTWSLLRLRSFVKHPGQFPRKYFRLAEINAIKLLLINDLFETNYRTPRRNPPGSGLRSPCKPSTLDLNNWTFLKLSCWESESTHLRCWDDCWIELNLGGVLEVLVLKKVLQNARIGKSKGLLELEF